MGVAYPLGKAFVLADSVKESFNGRQSLFFVRSGFLKNFSDFAIIFIWGFECIQKRVHSHTRETFLVNCS